MIKLKLIVYLLLDRLSEIPSPGVYSMGCCLNEKTDGFSKKDIRVKYFEIFLAQVSQT